jgi:hypothetical protein
MTMNADDDLTAGLTNYDDVCPRQMAVDVPKEPLLACVIKGALAGGVVVGAIAGFFMFRGLGRVVDAEGLDYFMLAWLAVTLLGAAVGAAVRVWNRRII